MISVRIRGAGLLASLSLPAFTSTQPFKFKKECRQTLATSFQCGKQAAHRRFGAATTTAGLEIAYQGRRPMRQCFAVCNPGFRQANGGLHLFGRIVKKLTKPQGSNRPESRVPTSDGPSFIRDVAEERWFSLLLLRSLALPGYRKHESST